jgi:hypothetical protein
MKLGTDQARLRGGGEMASKLDLLRESCQRVHVEILIFYFYFLDNSYIQHGNSLHILKISWFCSKQKVHSLEIAPRGASTRALLLQPRHQNFIDNEMAGIGISSCFFFMIYSNSAQIPS